MHEVRRLLNTQWQVLEGFPDRAVPDRDKAVAFVAENELHKPIGRIFLVAPVHLEGIYVDPAYRSTPVMHDLVERAEGHARGMGLASVCAYADGQTMEDYIFRLEYVKTPWSVWQKCL